MRPEMIELFRTTDADIEAIAELEGEIFSDAWSKADIASAVLSEQAMCYVAKISGETAAYVIGKKIAPEGEIYRLATHPRYRMMGYAKELLNFVLEKEGALGVSELYLEVRESNIAARKLYASCGFSEISVRKNYYNNPRENGICMHTKTKAEDGTDENTCV